MPENGRRIPRRKLQGIVAGLYLAASEDFVTRAVDEFELTLDGIAGDLHAGPTRRSGGREPWYRRGTVLRNERQLTLLAADELALAAAVLSIPEIKPQWIGGNMLLEGVPNLSRLPPRTLLFFANGATLKVDGDNAPCRAAGRSIACHFERREDIETGFAKAAKHRRGLVAWVEKPAPVRVGERFEARLPEQWLYV